MEDIASGNIPSKGRPFNRALMSVVPYILVASVGLNIALLIVFDKVRSAVNGPRIVQHSTHFGGAQLGVVESPVSLESCTIRITKFRSSQSNSAEYWGTNLEGCSTQSQ